MTMMRSLEHSYLRCTTTLLSAVGNNTQSGLLLALHSPRGKKRGKEKEGDKDKKGGSFNKGEIDKVINNLKSVQMNM